MPTILSGVTGSDAVGEQALRRIRWRLLPQPICTGTEGTNEGQYAVQRKHERRSAERFQKDKA